MFEVLTELHHLTSWSVLMQINRQIFNLAFKKFLGKLKEKRNRKLSAFYQ